jgi:hypothetical protein
MMKKAVILEQACYLQAKERSWRNWKVLLHLTMWLSVILLSKL